MVHWSRVARYKVQIQFPDRLRCKVTVHSQCFPLSISSCRWGDSQLVFSRDPEGPSRCHDCSGAAREEEEESKWKSNHCLSHIRSILSLFSSADVVPTCGNTPIWNLCINAPILQTDWSITKSNLRTMNWLPRAINIFSHATTRVVISIPTPHSDSQQT